MLSANTELAREAASFATVMAFVDGRLDDAKLRKVLELATALGVHDDFIDDIAKLAQGRLQDATAHMIRANLESVTGQPWRTRRDGAVAAAVPAKPDAALAGRFRALASLPRGHVRPRVRGVLCAQQLCVSRRASGAECGFAVPHDSTHVLAGYDTSPRGELLTSVLTAAMHRRNAMSGHVLPVILSWHLGIPLNEVAGAAKGALDPQEFWHAWARGERRRRSICSIRPGISGRRRSSSSGPCAEDVGLADIRVISGARCTSGTTCRRASTTAPPASAPHSTRTRAGLLHRTARPPHQQGPEDGEDDRGQFQKSFVAHGFLPLPRDKRQFARE